VPPVERSRLPGAALAGLLLAGPAARPEAQAETGDRYLVERLNPISKKALERAGPWAIWRAPASPPRTRSRRSRGGSSATMRRRSRSRSSKRLENIVRTSSGSPSASMSCPRTRTSSRKRAGGAVPSKAEPSAGSR
jgi:hypothetical protein